MYLNRLGLVFYSTTSGESCGSKFQKPYHSTTNTVLGAYEESRYGTRLNLLNYSKCRSKEWSSNTSTVASADWMI